MLSHDKSPPLRNLTVLPLLLSPDRDEELLRLTEGRVPTFSHDLVPDYLRTKPEPDVERQMIQMEHKAANLAYESAQVCVGIWQRSTQLLWSKTYLHVVADTFTSRTGINNT